MSNTTWDQVYNVHCTCGNLQSALDYCEANGFAYEVNGLVVTCYEPLAWVDRLLDYLYSRP